ncbi:MAG: ABC transporter ATP-binding protein [Betaproteobacteria bacterium]|nr:ABC transporter ATP-binding protein [Betaproteobacteria bacterium]
MSEPLLNIVGVSRHFGGVHALSDVTLDVVAGEVHALIGPNGAGKTTLIHQISGAQMPDAGRIEFAGADITRLSMHARVAAGVARSWQITNIFGRLSALDNVALAVQGRQRDWGSSFRFWAPVDAEQPIIDEAAAWLAEVGLAGRESSLAGSLAHGEQRQLELALVLATKPQLLLLDEPMAGMGPEESERVVELIEHLGRRVSILLVEHDMDAVFRLADRISVLVSGRLIFTGIPDEVRAHPEVRRAYLGDVDA